MATHTYVCWSVHVYTGTHDVYMHVRGYNSNI